MPARSLLGYKVDDFVEEDGNLQSSSDGEDSIIGDIVAHSHATRNNRPSSYEEINKLVGLEDLIGPDSDLTSEEDGSDFAEHEFDSGSDVVGGNLEAEDLENLESTPELAHSPSSQAKSLSPNIPGTITTNASESPRNGPMDNFIVASPRSPNALKRKGEEIKVVDLSDNDFGLPESVESHSKKAKLSSPNASAPDKRSNTASNKRSGYQKVLNQFGLDKGKQPAADTAQGSASNGKNGKKRASR